VIDSLLSLLRRLPWEVSLLRSSGVVFVGNASARALGFLFYVVAARLLQPSDYGTLAYALAILSTAAILLTNAPGGLARFLARNSGNPARQELYYSNWVGAVAIVVVGSILVFIPFVPLTGLNVWLALGVMVNLLNVAIFETYVQTQRGLGRFVVMGAYDSLANFLQLAAIVILGLIGLRSAPSFLLVYGLSAIAAVVMMRFVARTPLSLHMKLIEWRQMVRIARYVAPIIAQGFFWAFWWGADLILIQHLMSPYATGNYAAAKTLTQVLILPSTAICMAAGPSLARLSERALRKQVMHLLALGGAVLVPAATLLVVFQQPLLFLAYGTKYPEALDAFNVLVLGVTLYGFYLILASVWGAMGRPTVGAVATGCGTVATVAIALALIPSMGLVGAGIAFAAGAAAQLVFVIAFTLWGLYAGVNARVGHLPDEAMIV
jgi:O-antigen/teichoic acid export membrane protein